MNRKASLILLVISLFCLGSMLMLNTSAGITSAQVNQEPSVSISADTTTGTAPLTVNFTAEVNDPFADKYPITYDWHFDDGAASTKKNPQHTFTAAKTYTVTCKVTFWKSPKVTVQASVQIDAGGAQPFAVSVSGDPTSGNAPLAVNFSSTVTGGSSGEKIAYKWDFGDETTSVEINPTHTFNTAGTYKVTCTVTGGTPSQTAQDTVEIDVSEVQPLVVSVSANPTSGNAPLTVSFTSTVTGGSSVGKIAYKWDFGDETTSIEINPTHTFNTAGTYKVTCNVTGGTPSQTAQDTVEINVSEVQPLVVSVSANPTSGNAPLTVSFTSTVAGGSSIDKVAYKWDFGDETTSEEINPTHTFNTAGTYKVTCTVTGGTPSQTAGGIIEIIVDKEAGPIPVCTADNQQETPQIASDGSGGAIITWQDQRSGSIDIYARRIDSTGNPQWTANGVAISTANSHQQKPQIIADGFGGAIITWQDYRSDIEDIYARRVSSTGEPLWTADGVAICTAADFQYNPQITSDGSGGAIITWQDKRSGNIDIYARRIDSAGKPQWTADGVPICTAANQQERLQIISDGSGGAVITWQDFRSGNNYDIYARRISSTGQLQWTADGVPICTAVSFQGYPQITSDGSGGAIITWYDSRSESYDIYARRISSTGQLLWTADGVPICTAANHQQHPQIIPDGSGGAIITWQDQRSGHLDIYARRIDGTGKLQWTADGVPICTAANEQHYPQITTDGSGGAIITWQDYRSGNNYDIYARRISSTGQLLWTENGVPICTAANHQDSPQITSDGSGGAIITWQDQRSGNYDIYAQHITNDGELK